MKVTILKKNLSGRGGLENQTFQIAKAFQKKGCEVSILTSGRIDPHYENSSLQFQSFPLNRSMNFLKVYEFDNHCRNYLNENRSDIVFGMERNRFQTHLRLGNGLHRAYLNHLARYETSWQHFAHCFNPAHHTFLKFEKTALEHPDLKVIIANSSMVQKEILDHYKVDPSKIHRLHNGVDWQGMQQDFDQWQEVRAQHLHCRGLDSSKFQFLFVGHHYERKGLRFFLNGLSKHQEWQLSVVGHERNLSIYQNLAKKLGLEKQVFFFGAQNNVRPFYQSADCLAIPSIYDPFSNATLEALAMGLFVVSSKTNGGSEILTPFSGTVIEQLNSADSVAESLGLALKHRKTGISAQKIRASIQYLDFSNQLEQLIGICLQC